MASTIPQYSSLVDTAYPVAGINQSSQGFRSNFSAIKSGLDQAASEISNLQGKLVVVSGDITGTSSSLGTTNSPVTLSLVLPNITSSGTIDSLANNVQASVNTKGQITSLTVTPISTNVDPTITYAVDVTSMGTGMGTANFPTYKFDAAGKVTHVGTAAVTYGVQGHPAAQGRVVAGDINNHTALTPPPGDGHWDGTWVLTATGNGDTGLEWTKLNIPAGTVIGITAGPGVKVQQNSANPTVSADFSTLPTNTTISDADSLPFQSFVDARAETLTVSAFKSFIAQGFLASDVGSTHITSTDVSGVVINSPNGITLNSVKWPTTTGIAGQVLTYGAGGTLSWSGSSNATVARTYYVSDDYGNDTTGTGGFTTPYKTLSKALTVVGALSSGPVYVLGLLAGTYSEDVNIAVPNVAIKGVGGVAKPALTGVITIGAGTNFVGIENLKLDRSAQATDNQQAALNTVDDLVSLQVLDCDFIRGSGTKANLPIVSLAGNLSNGILFDGCAFQGQLMLNMLPAANTTGRTVITNVRQLGTRQWGITVRGDTTLRNIATIAGITHIDGDLVLENVGEVTAIDSDVTLPGTPQYSWTSGAPDYSQPIGTLTTPVLLLDTNGLPVQAVDGSSNPLYQADGVTPLWQTTTGVQTFTQTPATLSATPTGIYSTSNVGALTLHGVSMSTGSAYAPIYKTGVAPYTFTNVDRRADKDFIAGPRVVYEADADTGNFMPRYEADFNGLRYADDHTTAVLGGKLDPTKAKVAHVTLVGANAHLSLKTPVATSFNDGVIALSSELVTEFKVFVQQDATGGHHMIWSADSEPEILWYTDYQLDDAPNAITVFTFYYHSVNRQWIGMRTSKGAERRRVFTSTASSFTATLQHANAYIAINNATGATFQINGALANFPIGTSFQVEQAGAGAITFTALGGQNIYTRPDVTGQTDNQYDVVTLIKRDATSWVLMHDGGAASTGGGGAGTGSVTNVSIVPSNGISGTVANSTSTPAITLALGAITPSSVAAAGSVTGSNLSGTNTGDQTITLTGDVTGSGTGSFAATIAAGAVTLTKMANMATASLIYRKTPGTGAPEVNTLATLKTDLGLTGTNTGDESSTTILTKLSGASGGGTANYLRADGTWATPLGAPSPVTSQTGVTYQPVLADANTYMRLNNASPITFTVPANATVAYPINTEFELEQAGAGAVTISPAANVTIHSRAAVYTTAGQYAVVSLKLVAADTWILTGDM